MLQFPPPCLPLAPSLASNWQCTLICRSSYIPALPHKHTVHQSLLTETFACFRDPELTGSLWNLSLNAEFPLHYSVLFPHPLPSFEHPGIFLCSSLALRLEDFFFVTLYPGFLPWFFVLAWPIFWSLSLFYVIVLHQIPNHWRQHK